MKLAIMQPYFFPYIGYFQAIAAVDQYILYENLNFIKEGWMHRNRLLSKNNGPFYINVPVLGKSSNKMICDVTLVDNPIWKKKLLKAIHLNYSKSEYFDSVFPLISSIVQDDSEYLFKFNANAIRKITEYLDIPTIIKTDNRHFNFLESELEKYDKNLNSEIDKYCERGLPKKVARVISICKIEGAEDFINAIGGESLYNRNLFSDYDINLSFIKTNNFSYNQFAVGFQSNLSIIDVLMHNGKTGTKRLINQFQLI